MKNNELQAQDLVRKVETLVYDINNAEDCETEILQAILSEQNCDELRDMSLSLAECHVIDYIGRTDMINATAIAKKLNITKGGISKITAKLIKKRLIEGQRLLNNQKEIYYSLTALGKKVFNVHEILHEQAQGKFISLFSSYSHEELRVASKFLDDLIMAFQSEQERTPQLNKD